MGLNVTNDIQAGQIHFIGKAEIYITWASGGMADTQRSERCLSNGVKVQLLSCPQVFDTGRHAAFRALSSQGGEGSSPFSPTIS